MPASNLAKYISTLICVANLLGAFATSGQELSGENLTLDSTMPKAVSGSGANFTRLQGDLFPAEERTRNDLTEPPELPPEAMEEATEAEGDFLKPEDYGTEDDLPAVTSYDDGSNSQGTLSYQACC